eukprot:gb/GECH01011738.1/.p1 GENE.gb/GECH01011738.1/~~gb/GECH01011738.1/.p1  ORF type:complete len:135 (+),score=36.35 gb/GECH01011738.1/:1-405(+)
MLRTNNYRNTRTQTSSFTVQPRRDRSLLMNFQNRSVSKLVGEEKEKALADVKNWQYSSKKDAIQRDFKFKNFKQAWNFMSQVAEEAERVQHHPEWFNVYNQVDVALRTHDCDGISEKDINMAKFMDSASDKAKQ